eukprot:jgi/Pico_ML_1/52643/g3320.t2
MRTLAKAAVAAAAVGAAVVVTTPMLLRRAYNKKREKDKMGVVSAYTRKGFFAMMYSLVSDSVDQKFHSVKEKLFEQAAVTGIQHFVLVGEGAEDLFESAIGKFDVVVSTLVLCSVKQPDVVLKNVEMWLKPEAVLPRPSFPLR